MIFFKIYSHDWTPYQSAMREMVWGQTWRSAINDAGFLQQATPTYVLGMNNHFIVYIAVTSKAPLRLAEFYGK